MIPENEEESKKKLNSIRRLLQFIINEIPPDSVNGIVFSCYYHLFTLSTCSSSIESIINTIPYDKCPNAKLIKGYIMDLGFESDDKYIKNIEVTCFDDIYYNDGTADIVLKLTFKETNQLDVSDIDK